MITIKTTRISPRPLYPMSCRLEDCAQTTWSTSKGEPNLDVSDKINCRIVDENELKNSNRLANNFRKLEEISNFTVNWNGYGAHPLDPRLIDLARRLISTLKIQPELSPTADNSIQIEWKKPNGEYLEIQITLNEKLSVFRSDSNDQESEALISASDADINELVDKFYANIL